MKIQPATGSFARNLIYSTKPCQYLTARGVSTALYVHSDSGVIGVSSCPLLRKSTTVVDNG
ncbi:YobH family protein [Klebsiella pneumoniae]|uniref:YobH family protein n=1 Tax=Klebsiella pneumoniae TaxID=573 RepID=UPI0037547D80